VDVQAQCIIVLSRGLFVGIINEWRDRLKASLLLNGGQFERYMICQLSYQQHYVAGKTIGISFSAQNWSGMLQIFVIFQFCETKWCDRFHY